jgi:hypothetical protein
MHPAVIQQSEKLSHLSHCHVNQKKMKPHSPWLLASLRNIFAATLENHKKKQALLVGIAMVKTDSENILLR